MREAVAVLALAALVSLLLSGSTQPQLQAEIERLKRLRAEERKGRTNAEQALRELRRQVAASEGPSLEDASQNKPAGLDWIRPLPLRPIGILQSCFSKRSGTPRQPLLVPSARAMLRLRSGLACLQPAWTVSTAFLTAG
ncbi:hypothetical protein WJX84_010409 [Apatococcus fuscideae]|uniref:TsaA-like domain-containing protein n=1 Tax=Apatococcus fuscideae TaxID=2026836 RepID=A0AAW1SX02_9CHLO